MTAWTTPSTRSKGYYMGEDTYNDEIVNNILHLYERPYPQSLGYEVISNTAVETDMGTWSMSANALGTHGQCYFEWWFFGVADAARVTTFKVYIGATSLMDDTVTTAGAANFMAVVRLWVCNATATNSQVCVGEWLNENAVVAGTEAAWDEVQCFHNVAAIDTTAAWEAEIKVTMAAAAAGYSVALVGSLMEGPFLASS